MADLNEPIQILWFKRDLRLDDHAPLDEASKSGLPTLLVYLFEPILLGDNHYGDRHWRFVWQSLREMQQKLESYRIPLYVIVSDVIPFLEKLGQRYQVERILSHQETGIATTYERDKQVATWCKDRGIEWKEFQTNAVFRGLNHRDDWRKRWNRVMFADQQHPDLKSLVPVHLDETWLQSIQTGKVKEVWKKNSEFFQGGGSEKGWELLYSFVAERGKMYNKHISRPQESRESCSRLSTHITWGNLSIRQVFQYIRQHYQDSNFKRSLKSFESRLRWHCHFIQKFETEPRIEFENLNRGYSDIRTEKNEAFITAWKTGKTGFPLVDATMRCLIETGYINFRMRAMLVSFLTHHLWQDWRHGSLHLARQFLDFEPGIHYAQFQMQAGTLGPNSVRVYNPVKQSKDHDEEGMFIKKWVPELSDIPAKQVHTPW